MGTSIRTPVAQVISCRELAAPLTPYGGDLLTWRIGESPLLAPETQSTFHRHAQRSVRRPRALRQQPKIVARRDRYSRYSPIPSSFLEIVSDYLRVLQG